VIATALAFLASLLACNSDPLSAGSVDAGSRQEPTTASAGEEPVTAAEAGAEDAGHPDPIEMSPVPGAPVADAAVRTDAAGPAVTTPPRDAAALSDGAQDAGPQLLTGLSVAELGALCRWTEALRATPSERQLCISRSLQARSTAACAAQVESCVASHSVDVPPKPECHESFVQKLPARCAKVEVADYQSCAQAAADVANQRLASLSCNRVDAPDSGGPQGVLPACAELARVCPELAPDDSGASSPWTGGSFVCRDGWPLFSDEVCNGKADCVGGEDEASC
jgi:hypothetical protein